MMNTSPLSFLNLTLFINRLTTTSFLCFPVLLGNIYIFVVASDVTVRQRKVIRTI